MGLQREYFDWILEQERQDKQKKADIDISINNNNSDSNRKKKKKKNKASGVTKQDRFYQIFKRSKHLSSSPWSRTLLNLYNGSIRAALCKVYPWLGSNLEDSSTSYFNSISTTTSKNRNTNSNSNSSNNNTTSSFHREYLEWVEKQLNIKLLDDWYQVKKDELLDIPGTKVFLSLYDNSLPKMLSSLYPHRNWNAWQFENVHDSYWSNILHQRDFVDWVASSQCLHLKEKNDWYYVKREDIVQHRGGESVLNQYFADLGTLLEVIYPEHVWDPFSVEASSSSLVSPFHFWSLLDNRRRFFDWLGKQLSISSLDGWYQVNTVAIGGGQGNDFMRVYYQGYLANALQSVYPDYHWKVWRFDRSPNEFWMSDKSTHRLVLEDIAQQLEIGSDMSRWYNITASDVTSKSGGTSLLNRYEGSLLKTLQSLYPDYEWYPWLFAKIPKTYWSDVKNVKKYIEWLAIKLGMEKLDEWYNVSFAQIESTGGNIYRL